MRTEGKSFDGDASLTPRRMVDDPRLRRDSKTDQARETEAAFALGDCLYFYVGHACPDFGDIVFVYDPAISESWLGGATPFDTGGLFCQFIHARGIDGPADRVAYAGAHHVGLGEWRERFAVFVEAHFESPRAYVQGRKPTTDDPTGRLQHPNNERRAWTWEVRKHDDHGLFDGLLLLYLSNVKEKALWRAVWRLPAAAQDRWYAILEDKRVFKVITQAEPKTVCQAIEKEISSWL